MKKEIQDAIDDLEKKRTFIQSHEKALSDCEPLKMKFTGNDLRIRIGWEFGQLNGVLISMDVKKISELSEVLKDLGVCGWHRATKEPSDYAEIKRRTYELKHDDSNVKIHVSGFLIGETCRFVPAGKKEVEEYKLVCDAELN